MTFGIIGGGPVGLALALGLARQGLPVTLIHQGEAPRRTVALSYPSVRYLQLLLGQPLTASSTIAQVELSQQGRFGALRIRSSDLNLPYLGQVVPLPALCQQLQTNFPQYPHLRIHHGAAESMRLQDGQWHVTTNDGATLAFDVLLGADGMHSKVRQALQVDVSTDDYHQCAITCQIGIANAHDGVALERVLKNGEIMALLPAGAHEVSLVWIAPATRQNEILMLDDAQFVNDLQKAVGKTLGSWGAVSKRFAFPLQRVFAKQLVGQQAALLGNAAHTVHPFAAQGLNLGLRDVMVLANEAAEVLREQGDFKDAAWLGRYHDRRVPDQTRVLNFTHRFVQLFCSTKPGIGMVRAAGIVGLQALPWLKQQLVSEWTGFGAEVPLPMAE